MKPHKLSITLNEKSKKPKIKPKKEPEEEERRNITWEANHKILYDAYLRIIKKTRRCPTYDEIQKETGFGRKTISNHIKELKFIPEEHPLRVLTNDVILSIYEAAKKGKSLSQKLWMQVIEGWVEKSETDINLGKKSIKDLLDEENDGKRPTE